MERRLLLSSSDIAITSNPWLPTVTKGLQTYQVADPNGNLRTYDFGLATPPGGVLTPAQIRGAYGITGNGAGQTIAIMAGYDDVNALQDLQTFDAFYGLANPPSFEKVDERGNPITPGNTPGEDPTGEYTDEESLDIQWAHTMAPAANIVVVEMDIGSVQTDAQFVGVLAPAAAVAASLPGVSVVSMSFGASEFAGETSFDSDFTTPAGHQGVTFVASAGDSGIYDRNDTSVVAAQYPAASPNVVAVGGTTLTVNGTTYGGESAWGSGTASGVDGGGGGGISQYEPAQAYQAFVSGGYSTTLRAYPDVSLDADPASGVAIVDSYSTGSTTDPWVAGAIGGTSLAAPLFAGIIANVNEARALAGRATLDGPTQTLPHIYELPVNALNDITSGNNGDPAGPGFDLATGRGSPIGPTFIADLAANYIGYHVFDDANVDGLQEAGEPGIAGVTVQLESTAGTVLQTTTTDSGGFYQFLDPAPGSYLVHFVTPTGFQISPTGTTGSTILQSTANPTTGNSVAFISGTNGVGTSDYTHANCGIYSETISITDESIQRPQSGTANVTFTVTVNPASATTTFSIPYTTEDGTGVDNTSTTGPATVAHDDYQATSGTLVFAPGTTTETVTVVIVGNTLIEKDLIFTVVLSPPPAEFDLADSKTVGTGTIVNTSFPSVSIAATAADTVTRLDSASQVIEFPVTLSAPAPFPVTVVYTTTDVTAVANIDYLTSTGTLTFAVDPTTGLTTSLTQDIPVTILGGTNRQLDKQFAVNIAAASGATTGSLSQVEGTILTNDPPAISVEPATITESLTGTAYLPFQVDVAPSLTGSITITYATADGTAVAGVDYGAVSGTLTLAPGRIQQTVFVPVYRQFLSQTSKTLSFSITNPAGTIQVLTPTVTGTINYLPVTTLPITRTQKAVYTDTLGQKVTVGLTGPGSGTIVFLGSDSVATNAYELSFTGTTAATNVSVAVSGTGQTTVNSIVVQGSLNALSAKAVNVEQGVLNVSGTINSLVAGYLSATAVTLGGTAASRPVSINIYRAVDTSITSGAPIRTLVAGAYIDTVPTTPVYITAPSVGTVRVAGNFGGTIQTSGVVAALDVGGSITGGVEAGDGIGSVTADSLFGAVLTAGTDGQSGTVADAAFANAAAKIGRVRVRTSFSNSLIAGSHVGKVTLGSVDSSTSGTPFGIVGSQIASVQTVTSAGSTVNVADPHASVAFDDFEVNLA